jgi:hypothetical protein
MVFLQRNTKIFSLARSFYCWTQFGLLSLLFLSVSLDWSRFCCSVEFGYENAWKPLPKFSMVCGQHIAQCISLSFALLLSHSNFSHLICLYHSNLSHFHAYFSFSLNSLSLSLSLIYLALNLIFPPLLHYFSLIQMFIDLSVGTAAFLLVSNLQSPIDKTSCQHWK